MFFCFLGNVIVMLSKHQKWNVFFQYFIDISEK